LTQRPLAARNEAALIGYRAEMTNPDAEFGRLIVGCGTFGGIGGAAALIGKDLDDVAVRDARRSRRAGADHAGHR